MESGLKVCNTCGVEKPLTEFSQYSGDRNWRKNRCNRCRADYNMTQLRIPEKRAKSLLGAAKHRAKKLGLDYTISLDDVLPFPVMCPLLEVPLNFETGRGQLQFGPSLDRKDSSKGYTPDNIWVISRKANNIKNNATREEFLKIAKNWKA